LTGVPAAFKPRAAQIRAQLEEIRRTLPDTHGTELLKLTQRTRAVLTGRDLLAGQIEREQANRKPPVNGRQRSARRWKKAPLPVPPPSTEEASQLPWPIAGALAQSGTTNSTRVNGRLGSARQPPQKWCRQCNTVYPATSGQTHCCDQRLEIA
jgi:hypothetical protein